MKKLSWLLCLLLLSGCSWMKFWEEDDDKDASDATKPAALVDFDQEVDIRKVWRTGIGSGEDSYLASLSPVLVGDTLYAATNDGTVTALDVANGDKKWKTELDIPLSGGVGAGGGLVLVGSGEGELIALAADTGEERWRVKLSSEIVSPPGAEKSIVAALTLDSKLYGLSPANGETLWRYDGETPVLSLRTIATPVVTDSMVIVGLSSGKLVALAASDGSALWDARVGIPKGRTELERMVDVNTPLLVGDLVYAASFQGRIVALSRGTGRELWAQEGSTHRGLAADADQVYMVGHDDTVKALRSAGGQILWKNDQLTNRRLGAPVAVSGYTAVADGEGYLHLLSPGDGHFLARVKVDGDGISVPMAASNDTLYVLDNNGDITAYQFEARK
ncbi:MAG: outer membrane protein assembly factor BamB [Porticoccaceae bacterium]